MKNKEFYKEQIFEVACKGERIAIDKETNTPCICSKLGCYNCKLGKYDNCTDMFAIWCNEEYVEPCPFEEGELVEVSDNEEHWYLQYFDKFESGRYVTHAGKTSERHSSWVYCRKYGTLGGLVKGEQE